MRAENLFDKIQRQRSNRKTRKTQPYLTYTEKSKRSEKLLEQIEEKIPDKKCLNEALSQFIISDITAFEIYFKDLFILGLKSPRFFNSESEIGFLFRFEKLVDRKFDFHDLIIIDKEQIELPELLLQYQNFQNLDIINKAFSILVDDDFFHNIETLTFKLFDENDNSRILATDWKKKADEYIKLRHDLVHDFNPELGLNRKYVTELHQNLGIVVLTSDIYFTING